MKIYTQQIKDRYVIDEKIDYQHYIQNSLDILSISETHVTGTIFYALEEVVAKLHVQTQLTMACAKTLKPVDVPLNFEVDLVFGQSVDAEYPLTNPIELDDIIFGQILSEKPYTVYHLDAKDANFEEKKGPHPAFKDLDKLYKK
jgi:uncharacterized protein